jgi:hypothetical protein
MSATVLVSGELAKKYSSNNGVESNALNRLQTRPSAISPGRNFYGLTRASGPLVDVRNKDGNLDYVIALCEHECDSVGDIWFDSERIHAIAADGTVTAGKFEGAAIIRRYRGLESQPLDPLLQEYSDYTVDHRGDGLCWVGVRFLRNSVYDSGVPQSITALVRGKRVYDPRKDSTRGGSGDHRVSDSTTWEWTDNAALCIADFLTDRWNGMGLIASNIDWVSIAVAANVCDQPVTTPNGVEARYTINGVVNLGENYDQTLNGLLDSMAGRLTIVGDKIRLFAGEYRIPTVSITDSDVIGDSNFRPFPARSDRVNTVRCTYIDPSRDYTSVEAVPKTNLLYLQEDGIPLERDIQLLYTASEYTAQRLGLLHLRKSRLGALLKLKLNARKPWGLTCAENVQVQLESLGVDGVFTIMDLSLNPDMSVDVTLREDASWAYDWTPSDADVITLPPDYRNSSETPNEPLSISVDASNGAVTISWTDPRIGRPGVEFIDVIERDTNVFDDQFVIHSAPYGTQSYTHVLQPGDQKWYWVRTRHQNGNVSQPVGPASAIGFAQAMYEQPDQPSSAVQGDIWIDTDDEHRIYIYTGSTWIDISTNDIQQAIDGLSGNIQIYYQESPPSNPRLLDRWLTPSTRIRRVYVPRQGTTPAWETRPNDAFLETFEANIDTANLVDGKAVVYVQDSTPANPDLGDLWIDVGENPRVMRQWDGNNWIVHAFGEKNGPIVGVMKNRQWISSTASGWVFVHPYFNGEPTIQAATFNYNRKVFELPAFAIKSTVIGQWNIALDIVNDPGRPEFDILSSAVLSPDRKRFALIKYSRGWWYDDGNGGLRRLEASFTPYLEDFVILGTVTSRDVSLSSLDIQAATPSQTWRSLVHVYLDTVGQIEDHRILPNITNNNVGSSQFVLPDGNAPIGLVLPDGLFGAARFEVAPHILHMPNDPVTYNAGTVWGLDAETQYHIYCDDPDYAGGNVTYNATTDQRVITDNPYRYYVATIFTGDGTDRTEVTNGPRL